MTHSDFLRDLIVLYGMAMAIAYLMRRLRQSTLVGYLLTGILVGPHGLRLIANTATVELLADVGVALLLFTIGLELSLAKLMRLRQLALGAGAMQMAATVTVVLLILLAAGFTVGEGFFFGFLVAASSTAIVMKLLAERGEVDTLHGRALLGILLFQDFCVVPVMALLPALAAPGTAQAMGILLALALSLAVVGAILIGARYLFPRLLRGIVQVRSRELFVIAAIFFALGTAWGAAQLGLSLAIGAFLAGIVLSESEYGHQIMAEILPFRDSFNSLFFISVGMLIDMRFVFHNAATITALVLGILSLKLLTGSAPVMALGFPARMAVLVGMALAQVGEFSFVLLREGSRLLLVQGDHYQFLLAASALTMMATPALVAAAPRVSGWASRGRVRPGRPRRDELPSDPSAQGWKDHTIVCGFGLNGRRLARVLHENHLSYVILEIDPRLVRAGRVAGEPIYFGDVASPEILRRAGVAQARAVVVAISDPLVSPRVISHARLLNPRAHIIARIKRIEDARELQLAGATEVIAEEIEAWIEVAARVLRLHGISHEDAIAQLERLRDQDYARAHILTIPGQPLSNLGSLLPQIRLERFVVARGSPLAGVRLGALCLRTRTGASVLAIVREREAGGAGPEAAPDHHEVIHNPGADFSFREQDQIVLVGAREQLNRALDLLRGTPPSFPA